MAKVTIQRLRNGHADREPQEAETTPTPGLVIYPHLDRAESWQIATQNDGIGTGWARSQQGAHSVAVILGYLPVKWDKVVCQSASDIARVNTIIVKRLKESNCPKLVQWLRTITDEGAD